MRKKKTTTVRVRYPYAKVKQWLEDRNKFQEENVDLARRLERTFNDRERMIAAVNEHSDIVRQYEQHRMQLIDAIEHCGRAMQMTGEALQTVAAVLSHSTPTTPQPALQMKAQARD